MLGKSGVDEKKVFSQLIQKYRIIFGNSITDEQLKTIPRLQLDSEGNIHNYVGKRSVQIQELLSFWNNLSPFLAKQIAEPVLLQFEPVKTETR